MILIKLGGSVITDKNRKYTFNRRTTHRLIREIKRSVDEKMIIVHGGGSFGHPGAEKYRLNSENPESIDQGTARVQLDMRRLNNRILQLFIDEEIWAVGLPGGLITHYRKGKMEEIDIEPFSRYLSIGATPIAYGDVSLDKDRGVTICSGDDIMAGLASMVDRAVFVTDVDGIYKNKELITTFTKKEYPLKKEDVPIEKEVTDVTGGMNSKVKKMLSMSEKCKTYIVNGNKKGRLESLIKGKETIYTEVKV